MRRRVLRLAAAFAVVCGLGSVRVAAAASPPTCSFDPATHVITVQVNGIIARLRRDEGGIKLIGGAGFCGSATNTDLIVVQGGPLNDTVQLSQNFIPGRTVEADGQSEIEVQLDLGTGNDSVQITPGANSFGFTVARFTATGIDLYGDGDQDVTVAGPYKIAIEAAEIDGSLYPGRLILRGGTLTGGSGNDDIAGSGSGPLRGGDGNDRITGGGTILGEGGNDNLIGRGVGNHIEGGPGNDILNGLGGGAVLLGGDGNDTFVTGGDADEIVGGDGKDTVSYAARSTSIVVTLDGLANDGSTGEGDNVGADIENVTGGSGDDTLVGSSANNTLRGGPGNDEIFGDAGNDILEGQDGDDYLQGDLDTNTLRGGAGNDVLVGGLSGKDTFDGGDGDDEINATTDGRLEKVNCGAGIDSAEDNEEDVFTDCEIFL